MPASKPTLPTSVPWSVPIGLAVPALVGAIVTAFSSDHSVRFGFLLIGGYAIVVAAVSIYASIVVGPGIARLGSAAKAVVGIVGGACALLSGIFGLAGADEAASVNVLAWAIAGILFLLGAIDAGVGWSLRASDRTSRDWVTSGVIAVLGAIVVLLVPPDYSLSYVLTDRNAPDLPLELTASIIVVGLTGAILAILGVLQAIAGVSLMPSRAPSRASELEPDGAPSQGAEA